jgi:3-oxoacyl-[acyl-carrier-protein] synthase III
MATTSTRAATIKGITSCVPARSFDNLNDTSAFPREEVEKVVKMAGVKTRRTADDSICSSDLCVAASKNLLEAVGWAPETIDGLIMVTQSPDYLLPSTACVVHRRLGVPERCAAFDVGLGCSGYSYGLSLAAMMLQTPGFGRVLLLHGETPSRFAGGSDRSVALLFGDAGSATALEAGSADPGRQWWFSLCTDGAGAEDLIIEGGGFRERFPQDPRKYNVRMNGAGIFNFTIKRVPPMIEETLAAAGKQKSDIDYFVLHQSNMFIMKHLASKCSLPADKVPFTIGEFGSTGGPSVPLTITNGHLNRPAGRPLELLLLTYGVGLSWGSALVDLPPEAPLNHVELASR